MMGRGEEITAQGAARGRFGCRGVVVLRLGGDERHVQHDRRPVTARDGHREGVVAQRRGQPAPRRQADFQFGVGADESQEAFRQRPHGIRRHGAQRRRVAHSHQRKAACPRCLQTARHRPHAGHRTQSVIGVQQGERAALVHDANLRRRVDAAGLQAADGILQPRDAEGIEAGRLPQGALQADVGNRRGVFGRHAGTLIHLLVEGAQALRCDGCG